MTEAEAGAVIALLSAAYQRDRPDIETSDALALMIADLPDPNVALEGARRIITARERRHDRFPTVREIREAYAAVERGRREAFSAARGLAEGQPAPPPREWFSLGARLGAHKTGEEDDRLAGLEQREPGRCDDCAEVDERAPRYRYGRVTVCRPCVLARMRVASQLANARPDIGEVFFGSPSSSSASSSNGAVV